MELAASSSLEEGRTERFVCTCGKSHLRPVICQCGIHSSLLLRRGAPLHPHPLLWRCRPCPLGCWWRQAWVPVMAVTFSASPPRPPAIVEAGGSQADAAAAAAAVFLGSGGGCGPFGPWDGILVATGQGRMVCGRSGEDWACDDAEDLASDDLGATEG